MLPPLPLCPVLPDFAVDSCIVGAKERSGGEHPGKPLLPCDLPQLDLKAWTPRGEERRSRHPSGCAAASWTKGYCPLASPLSVPAYHTLPSCTPCLLFLWGIRPPSIHLLKSPLSQTTVGLKKGPGNLCGFGQAGEPVWNSVSPTVKWGQSSPSAVRQDC